MELDKRHYRIASFASGVYGVVFDPDLRDALNYRSVDYQYAQLFVSLANKYITQDDMGQVRRDLENLICHWLDSHWLNSKWLSSDFDLSHTNDLKSRISLYRLES